MSPTGLSGNGPGQKKSPSPEGESTGAEMEACLLAGDPTSVAEVGDGGGGARSSSGASAWQVETTFTHRTRVVMFDVHGPKSGIASSSLWFSFLCRQEQKINK